MQLLILTDRGSRRLYTGARWLATSSLLVIVALAIAFAVGFSAGVQDSPVVHADGRFEHTVQVMRQQYELDRTRTALAAEQAWLGEQVAALDVKAIRLDARMRSIARTAGLKYAELVERPEWAGPGADDAAPVSASQLRADLARLEARFQMLLPASDALEFALAERSVYRRTTPAGRPVAKGWISSAFGPRKDPVTGRRAFHDGLDFAARYKSPVLAVADGIVSQAGRLGGYGNLIQIEHGNGLASRYAHNQKNLVKIGDKVRRGDVIALTGSTGRSTGAHVHLEIWVNGKPVDPKPYVRRDPGTLAAVPK